MSGERPEECAETDLPDQRYTGETLIRSPRELWQYLLGGAALQEVQMEYDAPRTNPALEARLEERIAQLEQERGDTT